MDRVIMGRIMLVVIVVVVVIVGFVSAIWYSGRRLI